MIVCGEVIALNGETARIKTSRPVSCEGCANAGICGTRDMEISAMNFENAKIGERVSVEYHKSAMALILLAYVFLFPIFILFISVFAASIYPWFFLIAIPLIVVYYLGLKILNKKFKPSSVIVVILPEHNIDETKQN